MEIDNEKYYKPDFTAIQDLKQLPLDVRLNKVIDIIDLISNHAFCGCTGQYYKELHTILGDLEKCNPELSKQPEVNNV